MADNSPPPGFVLDSDPQMATSAPPPPPGFELDQDENTPPSGFKLDSEKYTTHGQQALTGLEGLGRGISAGFSDVLAKGMRSAATSLGVSPENLHYVAPSEEDISGRKEANPIEAGAGEVAGNIGLMTAAPQLEFEKLGQVGSHAVNAAIQMGGIAAGDDISKALLGKGDPTPAVAAHIAESGALGLVGGAVAGKAEQVGLKAIENAKLGTKVNSFLAGMGHAATIPGQEVVSLADSALIPSEKTGLSDTAFKLGQTAYKNMGTAAVSAAAGKVYGKYGALAGGAIEHYLEKVAGPYTAKISQKYAAPAIAKIAGSGSTKDITYALDHATSCAKGAKQISNGIENLFKSGSGKAVEELNSEKDRDKLKKFIEDGGVDKQVQDQAQSGEPIQGYAEGGEVSNVPPLTQSNTVSRLWPEQNIMINAAKGRVSRYLNSIRPTSNPNKLPYDTEHEHPQKKHEYNKILDIANQPLTILNKIKDGSLSVTHAGAFKSMFPELHGELAHKLKQQIIKNHAAEESKPSYPMRQAMSLFLGQNLESTLTPTAIQAAQNTFMAQKAQQPPAKNSKAELSKIGENSMTAEQARTQRQTKS